MEFKNTLFPFCTSERKGAFQKWRGKLFTPSVYLKAFAQDAEGKEDEPKQFLGEKVIGRKLERSHFKRNAKKSGI